MEGQALQETRHSELGNIYQLANLYNLKPLQNAFLSWIKSCISQIHQKLLKENAGNISDEDFISGALLSC